MADKLDERNKALLDAIQRVAEVGQQIASEAEPERRNSGWVISAELMNELRETIREWNNAGEQAMRTIAGRTDDECAEGCGKLPHTGSCESTEGSIERETARIERKKAIAARVESRARGAS